MKILVVSDTHGSINNIIKAIKDNYYPDRLIHLGDYVEDGIRLGEALNISTTIVRGNGDYYTDDYNYEDIIEINGKKLFLTHGHKYMVHYDINNLFYRGQELGVDYVLFGHTHVPIIERENNMIIMNPGSPTYPRGYNREKTIGMIEIGDYSKENIIEIK